MPTKDVAVKVKTTAANDTTLDEGQFVALASVFNNVDLVGDVVMPGAFTDDLKEWKSSGNQIPLYWGHRMDDPHMCIGGILDAKETDTGLQVKAQIDLDNPTGYQVYKLMKGGRVTRMSFAYDVQDGGAAEKDGQGYYELRKLKIHEISVVQVPANPEAAIQEVKSTTAAGTAAATGTSSAPGVVSSHTIAGLVKPQFGVRRRKLAQVAGKAATDDTELAGLIGQADQAIDDANAAVEQADAALDAVMAHLGITDLPDEDEAEDAAEGDAAKAGEPSTKAGRTISAKNEQSLRDALTKISAGVSDVKSVLAALDNGNDGKASPSQPATTEEPDGAKVSEPARPRPASVRLHADLAALSAEYDI